MKSTKKLFIILILFYIIFAILRDNSRATSIQQELADNVLRLHVLAASDSEIDQSHKLIVRDAIIENLKLYMSDIHSKQDAIDMVNAHLDELTETAVQTLQSLGDDHSVSMRISNVDFPEKEYGELTFPAGSYDSLQVYIGEAEGHNWWCVLYPSLCFIDATCVTVPNEALCTLENSLSEDTYSSLFEKPRKCVFTFRYLTFLNKYL